MAPEHSAHAPRLSVVVALQHCEDTMLACVDSLCQQQGLASDALDVILVAHADDPSATIAERCFPDLRLLCSPHTGLPWLMGRGIVEARGDLVALTEGHCVFPPEWAATAIAAHHASAAPIIGGAVVCAPDLGPLQWALFCCDYGQFLPPLPPKPTVDQPGNNIVFERAVLADRADLVSKGFWKTFAVQHFATTGIVPLSEPRMTIIYQRRYDWRKLIRRRFDHGRCFGGMRSASFGIGRRALYILAGPLLPWLLTYRVARRMYTKPRFWRSFVAVLPLVFAIMLLWSVGEWVGYVAGTGTSCKRL